MTLGFIGCGAMGGALYSAFAGGVALLVCEKNAEALTRVGATSVSLDVLLAESDMVLLAIKPQGFAGLMEEVGDRLAGKTVLSIMAGISMRELRERTGSARIVRVMPNLPVSERKGVLGWYAEGAVDREKLHELFGRAGTSVPLTSEEQVDRITLLSGCGPAYYAYVSQCLVQEGVRLGFSEEEALAIVRGTQEGAAALADTPQELMTRVASKGGVTEAVLAGFTAAGMPEAVTEGIRAGERRITELATS